MKNITVFSVSAALLTHAASAAVVYTETFLNSPTVAVKNFSTVGWFAHSTSAAVDQTNASGTLDASSDAVIWTSTAIDGTIGYGFGSLGSTPAIYWTTEPGSYNIADLNKLSVYSNHNNNNGLRFVARHDNNTVGNTADDFWVASSTHYINTGTGGSSGNWATNNKLDEFTVSTTASEWRDLTFIPGTSILIGAVRTVDLPTGSFNAFGLYAPSGTVRFDNFSIDTVPEPSALLFLAATLPLLARRNRSLA